MKSYETGRRFTLTEPRKLSYMEAMHHLATTGEAVTELRDWKAVEKGDEGYDDAWLVETMIAFEPNRA